MKKLTLELGELKVESFQVPAADVRTGTVLAHAGSQMGNTCVTECASGPCDCMWTYPVEICSWRAG